jgi:EamA-like transporter family
MTVFFFGTNFTAVKIVVESIPPILFAATRFTLAGCLLLLFVCVIAMANTPSEKASILPVSLSCPPTAVTRAPSSYRSLPYGLPMYKTGRNGPATHPRGSQQRRERVPDRGCALRGGRSEAPY